MMIVFFLWHIYFTFVHCDSAWKNTVRAQRKPATDRWMLTILVLRCARALKQNAK